MVEKAKVYRLKVAGRAVKNKKKGFSLTEMLCTVLIMSIVTTSAVTGMVSLANSYKKILKTSNAEELCNVLTTTMTGELGYAKYIETASGGHLAAFYSPNHRLCRYEKSSTGKLVVQPLKREAPDVFTEVGDKREVIASSTYADGLEIKNMEITYDETTNRFTVILEIGDSQIEKIAETKFVVQGLNAEIV